MRRFVYAILLSLPWILLLFAGFTFALPASKSFAEYDRHIWQTQDGLPEDTIQAITEIQDDNICQILEDRRGNREMAR